MVRNFTLKNCIIIKSKITIKMEFKNWKQKCLHQYKKIEGVFLIIAMRTYPTQKIIEISKKKK